MQKELILTGELKAARSTSISAPDIRSSFSNMVTFLAPEGSQIKKGERIVEFDDSSLLSQKSEAERTLDEAQLNIEKNKVGSGSATMRSSEFVAQAEAQLKQDQLYGKISKDLLPGNTYQKYQLNLEKSKLSLQKAKEHLDNFEKTYASQMSLVEINRSQAEINLKKIEQRHVSTEDRCSPGWNPDLRRQLAKQSKDPTRRHYLPRDGGCEPAGSFQHAGCRICLRYRIWFAGCRICDAYISFDALPGFEVDGRIVSSDQCGRPKGISPLRKRFSRRLSSPTRLMYQQLKPGMTARIKVPMVLAKEAPSIPREYLGYDPQGRSYVVKGTEPKTASQQFVELGAIGDRLVQVVSGVSIGDPLLPVQR